MLYFQQGRAILHWQGIGLMTNDEMLKKVLNSPRIKKRIIIGNIIFISAIVLQLSAIILGFLAIK